jgi:uncharacterized membrane protein
MKDLFYSIQDLFENVLFAPFNEIAKLELENWTAANAASWFFILIGFSAFIYWMNELRKYTKTDKEDKSVSAHSYL